MKIRFDAIWCSRCAGTGEFSYNEIDGTKCYGCGGTGRTLTKEGRAAYGAYQDLIQQRCTLPAGEITPGELVWQDRDGGFAGIPPMFPRSGFYRVYQVVAADNCKLVFGPHPKTGEPRNVIYPHDMRIRVSRPEIEQQIMKEVAAAHPRGATLITTDEQDKEYEAEQHRRDQAAKEKHEARYAKRVAAREQKTQARNEAARAAWSEAHPDLAEAAHTVQADGLLAELAGKARTRGLTDKQTTLFRTLLERHAAEQAAKAASRHLGTVGERVTLTARLVKRIELGPDRMRRTRYLVVMNDDNNVIKSFSTGSWVWDITEGEPFTFTATVAEHTEYKGRAETVVKNVRLVKDN